MKVLIFVSVFAFLSLPVAAHKWPEGKAPAVSEADPYVAIPGAALAPKSTSIYRSVFDATKMPSDPKAILPAVHAVGGLMNDLRVGGTPLKSTHFVVVFHGPATDGILDDEHYQAKYGVPNPNLPVLSSMRKMGIELYVCGQHLAAGKIDPKIISRNVTVAADAYLVLISFQNRGYASMWF